MFKRQQHTKRKWMVYCLTDNLTFSDRKYFVVCQMSPNEYAIQPVSLTDIQFNVNALFTFSKAKQLRRKLGYYNAYVMTLKEFIKFEIKD